MSLIWYVQFCRFGLVDFVWFGMVGWFGFFYKEGFKKPLVPLKVAKGNLELHLKTIPVRVGPIVILRLTQSSCAWAGTELGNKKNKVFFAHPLCDI